MKKLQFILFCLIFVSACSVSDDVETDKDAVTTDKEQSNDTNLADNDTDEIVSIDDEAYDFDIIDESDIISDVDEIETVDSNNIDEVSDEDLTGRNILIEQIYFAGMNMGEAILIIGPDGTSVLIDVANDSHSSQIAEAIIDRKSVV